MKFIYSKSIMEMINDQVEQASKPGLMIEQIILDKIETNALITMAKNEDNYYFQQCLREKFESIFVPDLKLFLIPTYE